MRLKSFTVQKYRSIIAAKRIPVGKKTVLVGPNNEGKSNILRALVTAMNMLTRERAARMGVVRRRGFAYGRRSFDWETDFPVELQKKHPAGVTTITLEFQLTEAELDQFRDSVGSRLTGTLPLQVEIGREDAKITVHKKGPGSAILSKKSDLIAKFVTDRIDFQQIEAVRTAESAEDVVTELVAKELAPLEKSEEYQQALQKLEQLQKPILDKVSASIQKTLSQFLTDVRGVSIQIPQVERYRAMQRACQIIVDDGTPTLLKHKGDGAQSLAALGIIRHASESSAQGKHLVVAIEEPESHLHPDAIHELKSVIDELSERHQVLLTTHNPLFVDRVVLSNNILVRNNRGKPATSIVQVREILGVRASDNLRHAEVVLLTEGEDDRIAVHSILSHASEALRSALSQGTLAIDTLGGSGNLAYKIGLVRNALCRCHVLLDDDKAGREAYEKARVQGLVSDADANFCIAPGLSETELEDLYETSVYKELIFNKYRVSLDSPKFKSKKKWSDRVHDCFTHCGKQWNDRVEAEVKVAVAAAVAAQPTGALNVHKKGSIDSLVLSLERRLTEREASSDAGERSRPIRAGRSLKGGSDGSVGGEAATRHP